MPSVKVFAKQDSRSDEHNWLCIPLVQEWKQTDVSLPKFIFPAQLKVLKYFADSVKQRLKPE